MKEEELIDQGQCSSHSHQHQHQHQQHQLAMNQNQSYQQQLLLMHHHQQQQQQNSNTHMYGGVSVSPWSMPQHEPFLIPPPPPPAAPAAANSAYASFFNRRVPSLQFASYEGPSSHHHLRIISDTLGVGPMGSGPFGLQGELGKMTAQEIMEAKALAASKSHSEAERRRRERINNHLAKLRSLLPNTTKTDKASLLAEVIQHVKELKRQTSLIAETSPVPTETDELTVDAADEDGKFVIKASLCCEDRSDLLPDLIKTLKALRLQTLKAEITTLGGRVKNVLFFTADEDPNNNTNGEQQQYCISSIQEALKAVMEKSASGEDSASGNVKRQRTNNNLNILEQTSL